MHKYSFQLLVSFLTLTLLSCQEGLKPDVYIEIPTTSYLTGTVEFVGGKEKFPDSTEIFGVNVVAFKQFPKDSSGILAELLKGNVKYITLPYPADSSTFSIEINDAPFELEYIAVTMQTEILKIDAQKVIGVYTISGNNQEHSAIQIDKGQTYFVRIKVDWDSLPPQPF